MTVTVTLLDSTKVRFDLDTVRPFFESAQAASDFVNSYYTATASPRFTSVNFKAVGDPILVPMTYHSVVAQYDIGYIKVDSSPGLFFRIRDVFINAMNQMEILYDIDYAASRPKAFKKGVITRCPKGNAYAREVPISPRYWDFVMSDYLITGASVAIVVSQFKTDPSLGEYNVKGPVYIVATGTWNEHMINVLSGAGYFALGDIINAWVIPALQQDFPSSWVSGTALQGVDVWRWTRSPAKAQWTARSSFREAIGGTDTANGIVMGVCDERGNVLYTFPDKVAIDENVTFNYYMSMSACEVDVYFGNIGATTAHLENKFFTYSARPLDVICDSWQDYLFRQRDADIQNRRIQNNMALAGSVNSALTGAMTGALMGSVVPGVGTVAGALVGGAGGLLTSGVSYGLSTYYGDKQQAVIDKAFQLAQDSVAVNGMITARQLSTQSILYLFKITVDPQYLNELNAMTAIQGVPADGFCDDVWQLMHDSIPQATAPIWDDTIEQPDPVPFAATVEANEESMPLDWKRRIVSTIAAGARWIRI